MRRNRARLAFAVAACLAAAPFAEAQTKPAKPAPAAAADAALDAQKAAFLALPLPTRVAAQTALVWLGLYNGVADGDFGKRTRDSIAAFQATQKAKGDGVLSAGQLQALLAAGDKARAAAGFETVVDPKTGAKIGAPKKLLDPKSGATLAFDSDAGGDLAALYAKLTADTPTRKIAYKAIKPGAFFVVSGEGGGQKFYMRYERDAAAVPPIRGFTFAWPARRADLDRVALAVANSFVAFPRDAPPAVATPATPAPAQPAPAAPKTVATALLIAPGRAVTVLKPSECPNPSVGGRAAKFERSDPATGLALLTGDFGTGAEPPRSGTGSDVVVLGADGDRISAWPAALAGELERSVVAALDRSAAGAPAFDRSGGLVGMVAPVAEPRRVAGVALAEPHALIAAAAIGSFLGGGALAPIEPAPQSVGEIAAARTKAVAAVTCGP